MNHETTKKNGLVQLLLGIYLLICGIITLLQVFDTWSESFCLLRQVVPEPKLLEQTIFIKTLLYTLEGTVLGSVIVSLRGLHEYGAIRGEFRTSYAGSYLIGPWAAVFLGVVVYALIRGGLLVFGGITDIDKATEATQFGYLGFGALIGFAWSKVLVKLNSVAEQIFSSASISKQPPNSNPPETQTS